MKQQVCKCNKPVKVKELWKCSSGKFYAHLVCSGCNNDFGRFQVKLRNKGIFRRRKVVAVPYIHFDSHMFPYPEYYTKHQVGVMSSYNKNAIPDENDVVTEVWLGEVATDFDANEVYGEGVNCDVSYSERRTK